MRIKYFLLLSIGLIFTPLKSQQLFEFPEHFQRSRLSSFENPDAAKNRGGMSNQGAKGNAFESLKSGETKALLNFSGTGIVQRIWLTVNDRSPKMLRALRIRMYWDHSSKAAVDAPLGDFFGLGLSQTCSFESALFSNPEGRSFNCFIPMPFRTGARITITNEGDADLDMLFYDVDFVQMGDLPPSAMYFHAYWKRETNPELLKDYTILPLIQGKGRFLGCNMGVNANPMYETSWWGEGEVKIFLDGDLTNPSYNGTGTEDYIGTGWGLGVYTHQYQGCTFASDTSHQYAIYRYHVPDQIYFYNKILASIQMIGGGPKDLVKKLKNADLPLMPISVSAQSGFKRLLDEPMDINDPQFPDGWVNFYRTDDYSSTAYFYLDRPKSNLPEMQVSDALK